MEREFLLRQSSCFCNPPTIRFIFFIILSGTFSALGLFLIRGRESVSPNRVDEMRNHRGPPYSIRRQVRMSCSCLSFLSLSLSLSLSTRSSSFPSIFLAYPSMDTSLPGSLTPVERFGFLSSYLTITRTWGPRGFTATATGGSRRALSLSLSLLFFLFRHKDFSYVNEGKIKIAWQFVEYKICLEKSFYSDFYSLSEFFSFLLFSLSSRIL